MNDAIESGGGANVLVIRSSEWFRGKGGKSSALLTYEETYCCLGLDARRCGIPDDLLRGIGEPGELRVFDDDDEQGSEVILKDVPKEYAHWLDTPDCSMDVHNAIRANDSPMTSDEEKIAELRPIFAKHGITIEWRPSE